MNLEKGSMWYICDTNTCKDNKFYGRFKLIEHISFHALSFNKTESIEYQDQRERKEVSNKDKEKELKRQKEYVRQINIKAPKKPKKDEEIRTKNQKNFCAAVKRPGDDTTDETEIVKKIKVKDNVVKKTKEVKNPRLKKYVFISKKNMEILKGLFNQDEKFIEEMNKIESKPIVIRSNGQTVEFVEEPGNKVEMQIDQMSTLQRNENDTFFFSFQALNQEETGQFEQVKAVDDTNKVEKVEMEIDEMSILPKNEDSLLNEITGEFEKIQATNNVKDVEMEIDELSTLHEEYEEAMEFQQVTEIADHYKCSNCPKQYYNKEDFNHHFKKRHEQNQVFCSKCDSWNKSFLYFVKHIFRKHVNKSLKCDICKKEKDNSEELVKHIIRNHLQEDPGFLKCVECGKNYDTKRDLLEHIFRKHEKPFKCQECDKEYRHKEELEKHKISHLMKKKNNIVIKNNKLEKDYAEKQKETIKLDKNLEILKEENARKDNEIKNMTTTLNSKQEQLKHCQKLYQLTDSDLKNQSLINKDLKNGKMREILLRINFKTFTCDVCGKLLADQNYLNVHKKKEHENVEVFQEQVQTFTSSNPFQCKICGKFDFKTETDLQIHHRMKHVERDELRVKCPHCKTVFEWTRKFRKHVKIHCPVLKLKLKRLKLKRRK